MVAFVASPPCRRPLSPGNVARKSRNTLCSASGSGKEVTLLDYGAGNVRSVRNAIRRLGYEIKDVHSAQDISSAECLIFPGVGSFQTAMDSIDRDGYANALTEYIQESRPFLGICLGLQLLFEGSEENGGCEGLGIIPGTVERFDESLDIKIPHIGWNNLLQKRSSGLLDAVGENRVYFVHSYHATPSAENSDWVLTTTTYGDEFISAVGKGNVYASQFHPEKSGHVGQQILKAFLDNKASSENGSPSDPQRVRKTKDGKISGLSRRVIACLDVRANDNGDLVVTKGDQYDVREVGKNGDGSRPVRNLGKPVELANRYFEEGADEVTFLNITGFRDFPLSDLPMLKVLEQTSEGVFVPLTVGGGIRGFTDASGKSYSALQVASEYFRSGADKVSIGSDAVYIVEEYLKTGVKPGNTSIEEISRVYGAQAVVVSIDPKRVYESDPSTCPHSCISTNRPGPNGEQYCWWQCTVKGGREARDLGAVELAKAVEELGAGEILLNCIDKDGTGQGFDLELVDAVSSAVTIPVIASSGAGNPGHFSEVFHQTGAAAALAAGIFHRKQVEISAVKQQMDQDGIPTRL